MKLTHVSVLLGKGEDSLLTLLATVVSLQLQKRPPNNCTPMMAKMRKNNPTTMETFAIDASDKVTDRNTSIIPGLRVSVL